MASRLFVFGCSFSGGRWATVADFIAVNFACCYSFAGPGLSNRYNVDRFFEVDRSIGFRAGQDHVLFQTTGWGRFGYWSSERNHWLGYGDLFGRGGSRPHPYPEEAFSARQAVYSNYVALLSLAQYLRVRGIGSTLVRGMDFVELWDPGLGLGLSLGDMEPVVELERDFYHLDQRPSIWQHCLDLRGGDPDHNLFRFQDGHTDAHPYIEECYQYIERWFPEWATDRARQFRDCCLDRFDSRDAVSQGRSFSQIRQEYQLHRITTVDHLWLSTGQILK